MAGHLETIVSLERIERELVAARHRLEGIPDWMGELHEEHSQRKAEIEAIEAAVAEADQRRRATERELAEAQEKARRFQEQISQVSTQREYAAVLKEIDAAKEQIHTLEQEAFETLESSEQGQKQLGELRDAFTDLDERYQRELAKWESEKPGVAATVDDLAAERETLRGRLPRPTLTLYDRIFERYGQAVSRVIRIAGRSGSNAMWHCEACSYSVRPQIVVEIRSGGSLVQCDACKRILYWEEDDGDGS